MQFLTLCPSLTLYTTRELNFVSRGEMYRSHQI